MDSEIPEECRRMMAGAIERNPELTEERLWDIVNQLYEAFNNQDEDTEQPYENENLAGSTWELDGGGTLAFKDGGVRLVNIEFTDDWHCAYDLLLVNWDEERGTLEYVGDTNSWEHWWDTFEAKLTLKYKVESDTIRGLINVTPYQPYLGDNDGSFASFTAKRKS